MASSEAKHIGLLIGNESSWPPAFMRAVQKQNPNVNAELVKLERVTVDDSFPYDVIIDRMSHNIPFYRVFLKFAVIRGTYPINNPFIWSSDDKFFGISLLNAVGMTTPKTILLPNKSVVADTTPESFRNLKYPLNWEAIVDYVGVPAIFKDAHTGGRRLAVRVHNVDELIDQYDRSGTLTMILQEILEGDQHLHCFVVGDSDLMISEYSFENARYLEAEPAVSKSLRAKIEAQAMRVTNIFGYDVNMVEFVVKDGEPIIINPSNPAPQISLSIFSPRDFQWCVEQLASLAIRRAYDPRPVVQTIDWNNRLQKAE
jgi:hypothetical protein